MTRVFLVLGDNSFGKDGNFIFGMYPTYALAMARRDKLSDEGVCESVWLESIEVGADGADLNITVVA
mgnify:CR=1 FL=1